MANWDSNGNQTQPQFLTNNWSIAERTTDTDKIPDGEFAIIPKLTFSSLECALLSESVIAKLSWKDGNSQATPNKPRVGKVGIDQVQWIATTCVLTDNPAANGGGKRIFPEKASPTSVLKNQVEVKVKLTNNIPSGMTGYVTLKMLDPMNQCKDYAGNLVGSQIDDNNGSAYFATSNNGNLSIIDQVQTIRTIINSGNIISDQRHVIITQAHAGDNYIVAAHPYSNTDSFISIDSSSTAKDQAMYYVNGQAIVAKQTELLTVWRTLWVEIDQLQWRTPSSISSPAPSISGASVTYINSFWGGELLYTANKPVLTSVIVNEFHRACIEIREYYDNNVPYIDITDKQYNDYGDHIFNNTTFLETTASPYSQIANNSGENNSSACSFWLRHVIACFDSANNAKLGFNDSEVTYIYATSCAIWADNRSYQYSDTISFVLLHELCHSFSLIDGESGCSIMGDVDPAHIRLSNRAIQLIQFCTDPHYRGIINFFGGRA